MNQIPDADSSNEFVSKSENESYPQPSQINPPKELGMSKNIALKVHQMNINDNIRSENSEKGAAESKKICSTFESMKKNSESRATPKQVFPNISCLPEEDNIIYCFILSVWDNIVGPQTVYVWKKHSKIRSSTFKEFPQYANSAYVKNQPDILPNKSKILNIDDSSSGASVKSDKNEDLPIQGVCLSSIVKYVTEHTVNVGDSGRRNAKNMTFFHLLVPHQKINVLSVRFYVVEDDVCVPYCLSAVVPDNRNNSLLPPSLIRLCSDSLYRISAELRILLYKEGLEAGDKVRSRLLDLCSVLSAVYKGSLIRFPLSTLAKQPDDRVFAERALTSHFQTMGTSLVIADSPSEANKIVMWLGQFLSEEEKLLSRISYSVELWPFQPGFSVQAVVRDSNGTINLPSSNLLASERPLTLIDVNSQTIRQMSLINVHTKNSCDAFRMELLALWHDLDHVPAPSQSLFESVHNVSPLVKKFLHEWDRLSLCEPEVKDSFLRTFRRSIKYTALSIMVWVDEEWKELSKSGRTSKSPLQAIASTFLVEESDMKIYLAEAESLRPGFISRLLDAKQ